MDQSASRKGDRKLRTTGFSVVLILSAATWLLADSPVPVVFDGATQPAQQARDETRAPVRKALPSVGLMFVGDAADPSPSFPRLRGSAVVVRKDGIIVTNYHVIRHDSEDRLYDEIVLSLPAADASAMATRFRVKPAVIRKDYDLALLRVVSDVNGNALLRSVVLPALDLGDSRRLEVLDEIFVIGYPENGGLSVTVNTGVVEGLDDRQNWIRTDARLMHGNSGGAAVNSDGKLIGIPTKIVLDTQPVDGKGEGAAGRVRSLGGVGFLRPAHLVALMLGQLGEIDASNASPRITERTGSAADEPGTHAVTPARPKVPATLVSLITLRGLVKSTSDGKPIAGARVGLVPAGSTSVTAANLLTWGGTNAEGKFEMNKQMPSGKYTLRAVAFGYQSLTQDIEVAKIASDLIVEMRPSP